MTGAERAAVVSEALIRCLDLIVREQFALTANHAAALATLGTPSSEIAASIKRRMARDITFIETVMPKLLDQLEWILADDDAAGPDVAAVAEAEARRGMH